MEASLCQNHIIFVMYIYISFQPLTNEVHNKYKASYLCVLGYTFCEHIGRTLCICQRKFSCIQCVGPTLVRNEVSKILKIAWTDSDFFQRRFEKDKRKFVLKFPCVYSD